MHLLCTIRRDQEQTRYEFLVRETAQSNRTFAGEHAVGATDRSRLDEQLEDVRRRTEPLSGESDDETQLRVEALGELIAAAFLPAELRRMFADPALQGAILSLETNESWVPWELAHIAGIPLWRRFAIARREIVARKGLLSPAHTRPMVDSKSSGPRALVLADPLSRSPSAVDEARMVEAALRRSGDWEVEVLVGRDAGAEPLLQRLRAHAYTLLHIACPAEYNPTNPLHSRLILADETLSAGRIFDARPRGRPALVFLSCTQRGYAPSRGLLARASGWARLFLELGAEAVVTPMWDVRAALTGRLGDRFYTELLRGVPLAEALRGARASLVDVEGGALAAAALACHGGAGLKIEPRVPIAPSSTSTTHSWVLNAKFHLLVTHGPSAGRVIPLLAKTMLQGRRITIGSAGTRTNEIDLDDPAMTNEEAYLEYSRGAYFLHNQSGSDETRVNGAVVEAPVPLMPGDRVEIGDSVIEFKDGPPPAATPSAPGASQPGRFSLEVLGGEGARVGTMYPLGGASVLLGRLPECGVRFDDASVSRRHALVMARDDGWYVRQEGSNPVLVNGVVVLKERRLEHGDEIQLSPSSVLRFVDAEKEVF